MQTVTSYPWSLRKMFVFPLLHPSANRYDLCFDESRGTTKERLHFICIICCY